MCDPYLSFELNHRANFWFVSTSLGMLFEVVEEVGDYSARNAVSTLSSVFTCIGVYRGW